jgi:isopentenyldiphosphate isomerase/intracellular septation protein A
MTVHSINKKDLLKNFTIGFIPLLIFIITDELFGTKIALITAISVGLVEFGYYFIVYRRIESFILFDVGLIIVLGLVSIILENELFFKMKPALIELILVVLLGIHAFSDKPLLLLLGQRYLKNTPVNDLQMQLIRKMSRFLFFVVFVHVVLIMYSAYYMSKEAWAFISGGLFYIVFGLIFVGQWLYFKMKRSRLLTIKEYDQEEMFDIVDEKGHVIGRSPRSAVHGNPQLLHPVVHLHIFNKNGHLYLQKRALSKEIQPGKWDTAVGGHVHAGEDILAALKREALEELGIKEGQFDPLYSYIMRNEYESELIYTYRLFSNGPFKINIDEIIFGKFWRITDISKNLGRNTFTPNFEQEFALLQKYLHRKKPRN